MSSPDRIELRRRNQAPLVGLHDPDQPVTVQVAMLGQPVDLVSDRPDRSRVPTAIRHAHTKAGGWMLAVIGASWASTL